MGKKKLVGHYISLAHRSETHLKKSLLRVADHHKDEPDIEQSCKQLADWSSRHAQRLERLIERYHSPDDEPENLHSALFKGTRSGGLGLLRDLHDLYLLAGEVELAYSVIKQAALALRDSELQQTCEESAHETARQISWIKTRIKSAAPQALVAV